MRLVARVDSNQREIVDALRRVGCRVLLLHRQGAGCPDILVGKAGRNVLMEIKTECGELTEAEEEFMMYWPGEAHIVRSVEDALHIMREGIPCTRTQS